MTGQHARLAPSSADRWVNCPGSVAMEERQPEQEETDESREGDAAHWLLARTIRKLDTPADAIADNGVPINDEMRDAIAELVTDVFDTLKTCGPGDYYANEKRLFAQTIIHPDNYGTPDIHFVQWSRKKIHIWDFKYGHRFVDAYRCWQLINYAAALVETENIPDWQDWTFTLTIAQPRCFVRDELGSTLREWFVSGKDLAPLFEQLRAAAYKASEPDAQCVTGSWCRDCRAAWDCPANLRAGGAAVDLMYGQGSAGVDPRAIGLELRVLRMAMERAQARLNILETKALEAIGGGQSVPFHQLAWTNPREVWDKAKVPDAAKIVAMFGVDVQPGIALPTPREVRKQGVDEAVIKPYVTKGQPAKKLVPFDDRSASKILGRR